MNIAEFKPDKKTEIEDLLNLAELTEEEEFYLTQFLDKLIKGRSLTDEQIDLLNKIYEREMIL